ncbi:MAG TPA: serine hydrolase domain-containing protein [Solimonas sp.]
MVIRKLQQAGWLRNYKVRVPRDLPSVTQIDRAGEAKAADGGLSPRAVAEIWADVENLYRSQAHPGIAVCIRRHGQIILNRTIGHARGNGPQDGPSTPKSALTLDTPVCLFSASKAVTAILIHKLAEEGGVDLDRRVSHYLPAFCTDGTRDTTLADVLAHRGGFPTINVSRELRRAELLLDWDDVIGRICRSPVKRGRQMAYHAITGGFILAEVLQRVTGQSIQQYLDTRFRQPMGLRHFTYGLPAAQREQVALNYVAGTPVRFPIAQMLERALMAPVDTVVEASNSPAFYDGVIPAGNLFANAEELSRFFQMLLDRGAWGKHQLLKPETVERAVRPVGRITFDRTLMIPMRYSEGMMLGAKPAGLYGPMTHNAYGHLGFMNILGWADPDRDIAASILVTGKAVLGTHLIAAGKLLATICNRCR